MLKSLVFDTPEGGEPHLPNVACGSNPEVSDGHENVGCWGKSGSRFWATGGLLVATSGSFRLAYSPTAGDREKTTDEQLLSGPQLKGDGLSQDDIDSLFD